MKKLTDYDVQQEVITRLRSLAPESQRMWGKMNVAQMMAHCSVVLETAMGKHQPPRSFIGYAIGGLFKKVYWSEEPFSKNSPTDKWFVVNDTRDFYIEKQKLLENIAKFSQGGLEQITNHPHPFFGRFEPAQWATGMYKHLDHHFRQFKV
jgi:hypothetical protein